MRSWDSAAGVEWVVRPAGRESAVVRPVSTELACLDSAAVQRTVIQAGLVTLDRMPVVWATCAAGHPHVGRVPGPDLMLGCCPLSAEVGRGPRCCGGAEGVLELVIEALRLSFRGLPDAGGDCAPRKRAERAADWRRQIRPLSRAEPEQVLGWFH